MVRIEFAAYADSPLACILRRRDFENPAHRASAHTRYLYMMGHMSDTQHFAKIVSIAPDGENVILGWMRWEDISTAHAMNLKCHPDSSLTSEPLDARPVDANTLDMMRTYHAEIEVQHTETMRGRPHLRKPAPSCYGLCKQKLIKIVKT